MVNQSWAVRYFASAFSASLIPSLTPTSLGKAFSVNEAFKKATRAAIAFLHETQGMEPAIALAYLSAAADFEVSQVVDAVKGVHCVIRKSDFRPW